MEKLQERMHLIAASIQSQADEESRDIIERSIHKREREIQSFEDDVVQQMFEMVQKSTGQIRLEAKHAVAEAQIKAHRQLLRRREELAATVYAGAKTRLFAYTATPRYRKALLEEIGVLAGKYDHTASAVLLREGDLELADEIKRMLPGCRVDADRDIKIGGWRLRNTAAGILIDESLDGRLEAQKPWFLQHCGLKISE